MISWDNFKKSARKFFKKSKARTEEALQITQLNQRLRTLRNERDECLNKLGEETYKCWLKDTIQQTNLQEICNMIQDKEKQITTTEKEKEEVREAFAHRIKEVEGKCEE